MTPRTPRKVFILTILFDTSLFTWLKSERENESPDPAIRRYLIEF